MGADAGFTQFKNPLYNKIRKTCLSGCELKVLLSIHYFTFGFHRPYYRMSYSFIAKDINCNVRTVKKALTELESRNIIKNHKSKADRTNIWGINENFGSWKDREQTFPQEKKELLKSASDREQTFPHDREHLFPNNSVQTFPQERNNKKNIIKDNLLNKEGKPNFDNFVLDENMFFNKNTINESMLKEDFYKQFPKAIYSEFHLKKNLYLEVQTDAY